MSVQFGPTCDGYGKPNKTWHHIVINHALKEYHQHKGSTYKFTKTAVKKIPKLLRENKKLILDGQMPGGWRSYKKPEDLYLHYDVNDPKLGNTFDV